jgi:hypothetical protein
VTTTVTLPRQISAALSGRSSSSHCMQQPVARQRHCATVCNGTASRDNQAELQEYLCLPSNTQHTCSIRLPQMPMSPSGRSQTLYCKLSWCACSNTLSAFTPQAARVAANAPPLAPAIGTLVRSNRSARYFSAPALENAPQQACTNWSLAKHFTTCEQARHFK